MKPYLALICIEWSFTNLRWSCLGLGGMVESRGTDDVSIYDEHTYYEI